MSKPPFTPGPWRAADNHGCRQIKAKKSGEHKQGQWYYEVACTPGLSDDDEDKANARLIAAAPDLHEALDWLLACVLADPASEVHPDDKEERLILACGAARTALAKANGQ
jgi:hypothetical protein